MFRNVTPCHSLNTGKNMARKYRGKVCPCQKQNTVKVKCTAFGNPLSCFSSGKDLRASVKFSILRTLWVSQSHSCATGFRRPFPDENYLAVHRTAVTPVVTW